MRVRCGPATVIGHAFLNPLSESRWEGERMKAKSQETCYRKSVTSSGTEKSAHWNQFDFHKPAICEVIVGFFHVDPTPKSSPNIFVKET